MLQKVLQVIQNNGLALQSVAVGVARIVLAWCTSPEPKGMQPQVASLFILLEIPLQIP